MSSDESEAPGETNVWQWLFELAYHHEIADTLLEVGGVRLLNDCLRRKDSHVDGTGGQHTSTVELRRCGWAAVAMHDRTNNPAVFLVGLPFGAKQTVPRAEDPSSRNQAARLPSNNADLWGRHRRPCAKAWCGIDFVRVPVHTEMQSGC